MYAEETVQLTEWLAGIVGARDPRALLGGVMHVAGAQRGLLVWRRGYEEEIAAREGMDDRAAADALEWVRRAVLGVVCEAGASPVVHRDARRWAIRLSVGTDLIGAAYLEGRGRAWRWDAEIAPAAARALRSVRDDVPGDGASELVAVSRAMREVQAALAAAARTDYPVLLVGETGCGKEVAARFVHGQSARACGPFIVANCAAIPESLQESEFFGHERGAFTGAVAARPGLLRRASGGTLFLDEVEAMRPSMQEMLLRAIESGEILPIGSSQPVRVDVRIVAATNEPLEQCVAAGRFRADLYYRLAVLVVRIPPLRERTQDIPALCEALLRRLEPERPPRRIAPEAWEALRAHSWPGNVRELENLLKRIVASSREPVIRREDIVFPEIVPASSVPIWPVREYVVRCYRAYHRSLPVQEIARRLGISRSSLWRIVRSQEAPAVSP